MVNVADHVRRSVLTGKGNNALKANGASSYIIVPQKAALADWKKSHKVSMMMMIAVSLMWAGAAEKPD